MSETADVAGYAKSLTSHDRGPAVVFEAVGKVGIRDVDVPRPPAGFVQIRTTLSMISPGTEGWILDDLFGWSPTTFPCVPGYQRVGIVVARGKGVSGLPIGQRVAATISGPIAPLAAEFGSHAFMGNSPLEEVYPVPDDVKDVEAAGLTVAQVGYNAASRLSLGRGAWVLIYGDGLIGQCASQAARALGYRTVLVGRRRERLALARAHSADHVVDGRTTSVADSVTRVVGSGGVEGVLDTVQTIAAQQEYLPLLRQGSNAQIVYCGFTRNPSWADMGELQKRELTTHYVFGWSRPRMDATLAMMKIKGISLEPLVTHRRPARLASELYALLKDRESGALGLVLDWTE